MNETVNLREKNIKLLKQYRPLMLERLTQWEEKNIEPVNPCDKVYATEAKDGSPVLHIVKNGKDHRLNSPYRPLEEANRWTEQYNFKNLHTNVVLYGMGNGLFAKTLLEQLREDATLALYEPSIDVWFWLLESVDLSYLITDKRVYLIVEDLNADSLGSYLDDTCHWTSVGSQITCHHTGYNTLFMESYREVLENVQRHMKLAVINRDTVAYFSHSSVEHSIKNLQYIFEASIITDYYGDFPDNLPFIIVSAGPSLDKNIELLKEAKGHCFILATDTGVRALLLHGILPDAIVTIDPEKNTRCISREIATTRLLNKQKENFPDISITVEQARDIPLFCSQESNHAIMSYLTGKKIWFKEGGFMGKLLEENSKKLPPYNVGGSVATAAFMICVSLKVKNIILIGQDLAYSGDVTHAGGFSRSILNEDQGSEMVEGVDGKPVKSRYDWLIYLHWFEESIQELKKMDSGVRVIDATEGGAKIQGTEIMTLREAIDECCDFSHEIDIKACLEKKKSAFDAEEREKVLQYLENCQEELQEMQTMAKDASVSCDKALKLISGKDTTGNEKKRQRKKQRYIDQIMNANAAIEKMKIYEMIDVYIADVAAALLRGIFHVSDDQNKDELELLQNAKAIYMAVDRAVDEVLPEYEAMMEKARESLKNMSD